MGLSFCSLASGSSGNCYVVKSGDAAILIDAGISTKKIHDGLESLGVLRSEIMAVLVTHEHSDHIKALPVLTKKNTDRKIFASKGTAMNLEDRVSIPENITAFTAGDEFEIGPFRVKSFQVSHDSLDPVCYSVSVGDSRAMILTDTGMVPEEVRQGLLEADLIALEANHEVAMLKMGSYPYHLKLRILGDKGHLSNETAGNLLADIMKTDGRFREVYLAHLSRENNFPALAEQTVKNILEENGIYTDRHLRLSVARRDEISCLTHIG